jgi:ribosomal protein S27E
MCHDSFFGPHSSAERRAAREEAKRLRQELRANSFVLRRVVVAARSLQQEAQRVVMKSRWLHASRQEGDWIRLKCPRCGDTDVMAIPMNQPGTYCECFACGQIWKLPEPSDERTEAVKKRA